MANLVRQVQRALLGSASPQKVRARLAELQIPAGGSGEDAMRRIRKNVLRNGQTDASLASMRAAFGDLGLSGGGGDPHGGLRGIRKAILRNL